MHGELGDASSGLQHHTFVDSWLSYCGPDGSNHAHMRPHGVHDVHKRGFTGRNELQAAVSSTEPQSALLQYQEQQLKPTTYLILQ